MGFFFSWIIYIFFIIDFFYNFTYLTYLSRSNSWMSTLYQPRDGDSGFSCKLQLKPLFNITTIPRLIQSWHPWIGPLYPANTLLYIVLKVYFFWPSVRWVQCNNFFFLMVSCEPLRGGWSERFLIETESNSSLRIFKVRSRKYKFRTSCDNTFVTILLMTGYKK